MNIKKFILIAMLLLFSKFSFSQYYFSNFYPGFSTGNAIETDSGYGTVSIIIENGLRSFQVIQTDFQGIILDTFKISTVNNFASIADGTLIKLSNKSYLASAYRVRDTCVNCHNGYLINITQQFNDTIWTKEIQYQDSITTIFRGISQTNDKGFIITGDVLKNNLVQTLLIKTDSLGNVEWEKIYTDGVKNSEGLYVLECSDGGYLIGGKNYIIFPEDDDGFVIKTDSLGNEEWQRNLGGNLYDTWACITKTEDNNYIAVSRVAFKNSGNPFYPYARIKVQKFELDGTIIWDKYVGDLDSTQLFPTSIYPINQGYGGYIIGGLTYLGHGGAFKISSTGDSIWTHRYFASKGNDPSDFTELYDLRPTSDGGFIGGGKFFGFPGPIYPNGIQNTWLVKMDYNGFVCDTPGCIGVGIEPIKRDFSNFRVFPNPTKSHFTADFSRFNIKRGKIEVYNMQGKIIQEKPIYWGNRQSFFQVQDWQSGIYLIRLVSEGRQLAVKKIVVE